MATEIVINVAKDFSDMPYGRYDKDGDNNGKKFREEFLVPALKKYDKVIIELDGALGYGSSFLDEAFGGLVRDEGYQTEEVLRRMSFTYKYKSILNNIDKYIKEAGRET